MEKKSGLCVTTTAGKTLPLMNNTQLLNLMGNPRPPEWVEQRIGIETHSLNLRADGKLNFPDQNGLDWAHEVAEIALVDAGYDGSDIDHLVYCSCTPANLHFQQDTIELHRRLGMREDAVLHQVDPGCAGLSNAVQLVQTFYLAHGQHRQGKPWRALIVAQNDVSSMFNREYYLYDPDDQERRGAWLAPTIFGDAAAAMLWEPWEPGAGPVLADTYVAYNGNQHLVDYRGGGVAHPTRASSLQQHVYLVDGRAVAKSFSAGIKKVWQAVSAQNNLTMSDVGHVFVHQANLRLLEHVVEELGIPTGRWSQNVSRYANTVTPSTMLLFHEARCRRQLPQNDPIVFLTIGAGTVFGGFALLPQG